MNKYHSVVLAVLSGAVISVTPVAGQATFRPDEVEHRNDCRLAHQVLVHGQPANKRSWAISYSNGCGALGGEALAKVLPEFRSVSAPGGEMETVVKSAASLTDRRIFEAALALAADNAASEVARVQAIRIVYHQLNPATFYAYNHFIADSRATGSFHTPFVVSEAPPVGTPLAADALQRAHDVLKDLEGNGTRRTPLNIAAEHVVGHAEITLLVRRLCGTDRVATAECARRLDEWEEQQESN